MTHGIVVLYNDSSGLIKGEARDMLAERGVVTCALAIADALEGAGHRVARAPLCQSVEEALLPYPAREWVVFNVSEGLGGRLFEEARFAWTMEAMGYRFTGNTGDTLARTTHKGRTKRLLASAGIPTPLWIEFRDPDEVSLGKDGNTPLLFPLIVKPVAEDASLGIGAEAVVHTHRALRERVAYITEQYQQVALAEEFICGREFNISLWDDPVEVLPLAEIDFSAFADPCERIVSFEAKWEDASFDYRHTPVACPASVTPELGSSIRTIAREAWQATDCRGYARVDMRVAADETPYVIEINCNPDLSPDAGFARAAQAGGYDYVSMITRILEMAIR
jgi:D-alanine-D-alanine ligase